LTANGYRPRFCRQPDESGTRAQGHCLRRSFATAGIRSDGIGPLFRPVIGKAGVITEKPMNRVDAYRMIRRRTAEAGLKVKLGCHVATSSALRPRELTETSGFSCRAHHVCTFGGEL
jgi:hypothetical protein